MCVHPWHCVIHCVCSAGDEWNTEGMWTGCLRCLSDCQVCQDEWGVCLREAPVLVSAELSGAWSTFVCSALTDRKEESSKEQWDHDLQPSWNEIKEGNISVFFCFFVLELQWSMSLYFCFLSLLACYSDWQHQPANYLLFSMIICSGLIWSVIVSLVQPECFYLHCETFLSSLFETLLCLHLMPSG